MAAEEKLTAHLKLRGVSESSRNTYLGNFRRMVVEGFDGEIYPAPTDARERLVLYMQRMTASDYAPITVRNYLTTAHFYFESIGEPWVTKGLKPPVKVVKKLTLALLPGEVDKMLAGFTREQKQSAAAFKVLLLTGLRLSEFVSMECTEDDIRAQRVTIKAPSGFKRPVYVGEKAAKLIQGLMKPRRKIPRGEPGRHLLTKHFHGAADAAGIEGFTPSRVRMTYAVRMLAAGHDFEFIAKNLGFDQASGESRRRLRDVFTDYVERLNEAD